ncbi:hypothetical protein PACTADRAFT_51068 [Pachysolen tannophilus NRRL Y-2460]|uniref:C2H2-type domain-containing protein n=1 Tax=Pachysolen tannophilus NRRL Y-2460 TaxID=669874 RepID=A0A1E4TR83_PACTA|nr:hypothetical protein PACTADRAFT_51068 [Pachysolen tannophilus NRRL Y-2460]
MNINVNNELENVKSGRIDMKYPCTEKHCNKKFCRKDSLTRHHRLVHLNKTSRFNRRIAKDNIQ